MTVNTNDVLSLVAQGIVNGGHRADTTYKLQLQSGALDDADVLDDVAGIMLQVHNILEALLSVLLVINQIRVINLTQDVDLGSTVLSDTTPGEGAGLLAPHQIACGLVLTTARIGSVGKKFWPGFLSTAFENDGGLAATVEADLVDVGDYMTDLVVDANGSYRFGIVSTLDGVFLPFTGYVVPSTPWVQRRRRPGVGI